MIRLYRMLFVAIVLFVVGAFLPVIADDAPKSVQTLWSVSPEEIVFSKKSQACDAADFPDEAARAFRDKHGTVHLIASHYINRASLGESLDSLRRDCTPIYVAAGDADPAAFSDQGWLESFFTEDGLTVSALVSEDYHPIRHGVACSGDSGDCWYSAITAAYSVDEGRHFVTPKAPANFIVGPMSPFDTTRAKPVGAFVPSNIIKSGHYYYVMVSRAPEGHQEGGECVLRSSNILIPQNWRGWGGSDFDVQFVSPYQNTTSGESGTARPTCSIVGRYQLGSPVRSLLKGTEGEFVAIFQKSNANTEDRQGAYLSKSHDLIHWSSPELLLSYKVFDPAACSFNDPPSYWYPSFIDAEDKSMNFDDFSNNGYVYLTKFNKCGWSDRDLIRHKVILKSSYQ